MITLGFLLKKQKTPDNIILKIPITIKNRADRTKKVVQR